MNDPLRYLTYDDLDEPLQQVAHYLGMDAVRELVRHLAGETITVPNAKRMPGLVRRFVEAEHNGRNIRTLARQLGASQTHVRNTLRELREADVTDRRDDGR